MTLQHVVEEQGLELSALSPYRQGWTSTTDHAIFLVRSCLIFSLGDFAMQLISRSLRGRTFLIQFIEIMREFGAEIPWLEPLQNIAYATNAAYVRDRLLRAFSCHDPSEVTPYQFVTAL